jgi:hypothetical protein
MQMKMNAAFALGLLVCGAALTISAGAQTDNGVPHLRKQGTATQLIVDCRRQPEHRACRRLLGAV